MIERPEEIAKDETPTIDVIFHVFKVLEKENYNPNVAVLLQPTSPLRSVNDIAKATKLFLESDCESVVSVCEMEHSPYWSFTIDGGFLKPFFDKRYLRMRRQDLEVVYIPNGAIYVSTPQTL